MWQIRLIFLVFAFIHINGEIFQFSVIHINDFHSRFEETNEYGGICKNKTSCIGGFSRLFKQITAMKTDNPASIVLNAGGDFIGTNWFNVGRWNVTQQFMNTLPFDAGVTGNHVFDDGIPNVVSYIKSLQYSILISNVNDTFESNFQPIYSKSKVIERNGKKIGIIGVMNSKFDTMYDTGNILFYPESASVNEEAERLVLDEGVFTNIVVSHCGYDVDQNIAANASETISLIVGAYTHTFLYSGAEPPGVDKPHGPYPTVVQNLNKRDVLVVQTAAYSRYVGNITVYLDESGQVVNYTGAPIYLHNSFQQDDTINQQLQFWKELVDVNGSQVLGSTLVTLSNDNCAYQECTLGNFVADAMVYHYGNMYNPQSWTDASVAVINPTRFQNSIEIGDIDTNDLRSAIPHEDRICVGEIEGKYIKEIFEYNSTKEMLLQVSGMKIKYDFSRPEGNRIHSIRIRCQNCTTPIYEPLDLDKIYRIITIEHLALGREFYSLFSHLKNVEQGPLAIDVIKSYLKSQSPVFKEENGRIEILTEDNNDSESNSLKLVASSVLVPFVLVAACYFV